MNPHQKNKVDVSVRVLQGDRRRRLLSMIIPRSLPANHRSLRLSPKKNRSSSASTASSRTRRTFSGDYALSKAGKSDNALVGGLGREHPSPDTIPHLSQQNSNSGSSDGQHGRGSISGPALTPTVSHGQAGSPVKESLLQRGMSVDEQDADEVAKVATHAQGGEDETGGVPIRR
jgi:hypothetical protein